MCKVEIIFQILVTDLNIWHKGLLKARIWMIEPITRLEQSECRCAVQMEYEYQAGIQTINYQIMWIPNRGSPFEYWTSPVIRFDKFFLKIRLQFKFGKFHVARRKNNAFVWIWFGYDKFSQLQWGSKNWTCPDFEWLK